ncbi:hypothetical protein BaRGS_00017957, partial [Batillaria attramentaria]
NEFDNSDLSPTSVEDTAVDGLLDAPITRAIRGAAATRNVTAATRNVTAATRNVTAATCNVTATCGSTAKSNKARMEHWPHELLRRRWNL